MATALLTPNVDHSPAFPRAVKLIGALVLAIVMLFPVVIAAHSGIYDSFVDNVLSGWGMWGTFAIHMWTRPSRKECGVTVALGVISRLTYDVIIGERGYPGSVIIAMGAFLGLASLMVLAVQSLRANERRSMSRRSLVAIGLLSYIGVCLPFYMGFAKMALRRKYDYYLYAFDSSLGFLPSFSAGKLVGGCAPLFWILVMAYNSLGFWFSLIYAVHANARIKYPINILKIFIANAFIGFSMYFLFPAMGPKYAFPSFPQEPGAVRPEVALLNGIPNAMPSLHFAGSLLIFWLSKPWRWLYCITGAFAALTALATVGLGEHYMVDIIVAVPYALAILAFGCNVPQRRWVLVGSTLMVLAWLGILHGRHFAISLSWTLIAVTISAAATLERRLTASMFKGSDLSR
jgi:hypothetical protein